MFSPLSRRPVRRPAPDLPVVVKLWSAPRTPSVERQVENEKGRSVVPPRSVHPVGICRRPERGPIGCAGGIAEGGRGAPRRPEVSTLPRPRLPAAHNQQPPCLSVCAHIHSHTACPCAVLHSSALFYAEGSQPWPPATAGAAAPPCWGLFGHMPGKSPLSKSSVEASLPQGPGLQ